jgi:aldose sugar dehydrogenase
VQGAALHPETGELWIVEHGPRGGDELGPVRAGRNHGWPVITYGINYDGSTISGESAREGMEQPVYYWDPVIAPSGMAFYTADAIPGWRGSILIGSLNPGGLVRLTMSNGRVSGEERHLTELGQRIRDVRQGPDGFVYLLTDAGSGRILRVRPATQ